MKPDRPSTYSKALGYGLGASLVIHLLVLVLFRFSSPTLEGEPDPTVTFEPAAPVALAVVETPAPIQVSQPAESSAPEMVEIGESLAGAASSSASTPASAQPAPAAAPSVGDPILPAAEVARAAVLAEPVLAVTEPALAVLEEAAEAETTSEELAESVPVWTPGGVGKAKRQWANNGSGASTNGDGDGVSILVGRGGGHCPMPGRGRGGVIPRPAWF